MDNSRNCDLAQFYALKLRHEIQRMNTGNFYHLVLLALVSTIQKKLKGE